MKKRLLSILLCLSMVFGIAVPTMTPQADAVIGAVIGTSLKMCTSLVKGGIIRLQERDAEHEGAGQGVLADVQVCRGGSAPASTSAAAPGAQTQETVIQKVDLSQVEAGAQAASARSWRRTAPPSISWNGTVSNGLRQPVAADGGPEPADPGCERSSSKYSTYLDTFFEFFNRVLRGPQLL